MENNHNNKHHVKWTIFVWTISIIFLLFGVVFTMIGSTNGRLEEISDSTQAAVSEIRVNIGEIKTDIQWIRRELNGVSQ